MLKIESAVKTFFKGTPQEHTALRGLSLLTSRYEAELELLVFSAWSGIRLVSEDVRVYYPPREERVSHFRPVRDFLRISLLNTVLCLLALVVGLPLTILRSTFRFLKTLGLLLVYVMAMLLVVTPVAFLYLKLGRVTERKKEWLHRSICRLAGWGTKLLGWAGNPYTPVNPEGEDFRRPAVLICNHQSHLDLLPMLSRLWPIKPVCSGLRHSRLNSGSGTCRNRIPGSFFPSAFSRRTDSR